MSGAVSPIVGTRSVETGVLRFSLTLVAFCIAAQPSAADVYVTGEFQPSDFGFPRRPTATSEITYAIFGRDLSFGFIQPIGWNGAQIRWSGAGWPEGQETFLTDYYSADVVQYYTLHHVSPGQTFVFKVQSMHEEMHYFESKRFGPWVEITVKVPNPTPPSPKRPPAPLPAPPPAPPPPRASSVPLTAPKKVFAMRQNKTDVNVYWNGAQGADWYVVERRVAVGPLAEGAGSTSWAPASSKLKAGRGQFIAHFPELPGQLKNIFRVTSYNSKGHAVSIAVAEYASKVARTVPTSPPGPTIHPSPRSSQGQASNTKVNPRAADAFNPGTKNVTPLK
jgi:hypothetical protein